MYRALVVLVAVLGGCGRANFGAVPLIDADADTDAAIDASPLDDGLLVHLEFENALQPWKDSALGHEVTCVMCPTLTPSDIGPNHAGGVALFDQTQWLQLSTASDLQPTIFSVALWGRGGALQDLISRPYQGAIGGNNTFELFFETALTIRAHMLAISVEGVLPTTSWNHIAATYDGAQLTIYVNGVAGSSGPAALMYDASDLWLVGSDVDSGAPNNRLLGAVDDVRIYNRVLTADEISALATP